MNPLLARLAIVGVSILVSTVIPYFVQNRPVLSFVAGRFGPQIVDKATEKIEEKLGPAAPLPPGVCPPCPTVPAPSPDSPPDVNIPVPPDSPPPLIPNPGPVVESAWDKAIKVVKKMLRIAVGV